jgi:CheY-like chemotaxis protein
MNDFSDLSQVESGEMRLQPVTFSLLPELGEIFSLLQTHAWKKRLELRLAFRGQVPDTVHLDAARLRQVLCNVVGELIDDTERGTLRIEVACETTEGTAPALRLIFRVSGPSPADTKAPSAEDRFEPFSRGPDRLLPTRGQQRLGLPLARRVARLLGGDVVSTPGEGFYAHNIFTITVAAGPAEGVRFLSQVDEADLRVRDSALFSGSQHPLAGMSVLLVEDSPDIQILIRHFLKKFGAQVELAENGEQGVSLATKKTFDVILMDLQLPDVNGFEATRQLRNQGYRAPIVALTAHALNDVRERCLRQGFDEYMTKPIHATALIELLRRHAGAAASAKH